MPKRVDPLAFIFLFYDPLRGFSLSILQANSVFLHKLFEKILGVMQAKSLNLMAKNLCTLTTKQSGEDYGRKCNSYRGGTNQERDTPSYLFSDTVEQTESI
jgi:hypothetical protein